MGTKQCKKCGIEKPLNEFVKNKLCKDGYERTCKKCAKKIRDAKKIDYSLIDENITKKCSKCKIEKSLKNFNKAKSGKYGRRSDCKECQKQMKKKWDDNNKDYKRKYKRQWHENNLSHVKEYAREYKKTHKLECSIREEIRRTRKMLLPNDLTADDWNEILEYFDNRCILTNNSSNTEMEHFIPVSIGHGGTIKENVYPLNYKLNYSKNNKNPFEWIATQPIEYQERFHNVLVPYLADLNNMSVETYTAFVNWCYENPRTIEEVKADNEKGLTSVDLFYQAMNEQQAI